MATSRPIHPTDSPAPTREGSASLPVYQEVEARGLPLTTRLAGLGCHHQAGG